MFGYSRRSFLAVLTASSTNSIVTPLSRFLNIFRNWDQIDLHSASIWQANNHASPTSPGTALLIHPALQPLPQPRIFKIPGKDLAKEVEKLRDELISIHKTSGNYAVSRIFQLLPINVIQDGPADQLVQRGFLKFSSNAVSNTGQSLDVEFGDRTLGRLIVTFPEQMQAAVSSKGGDLHFDFSKQPVVVLFRNLDPKWKVLSNQRLTSIVFQKDSVSYLLVEKADPSKAIELVFDMTMNPPRAELTVAPRFVRASFDGPDDDTFVGPFTCKCCGGIDKNKKPSPGFELKAQCISRSGETYTITYNFATFANINGEPDDNFHNKSIRFKSWDYCRSGLTDIQLIVKEIAITRDISGNVTTTVTAVSP